MIECVTLSWLKVTIYHDQQLRLFRKSKDYVYGECQYKILCTKQVFGSNLIGQIMRILSESQTTSEIMWLWSVMVWFNNANSNHGIPESTTLLMWSMRVNKKELRQCLGNIGVKYLKLSAWIQNKDYWSKRLEDTIIPNSQFLFILIFDKHYVWWKFICFRYVK